MLHTFSVYFPYFPCSTTGLDDTKNDLLYFPIIFRIVCAFVPHIFRISLAAQRGWSIKTKIYCFFRLLSALVARTFSALFLLDPCSATGLDDTNNDLLYLLIIFRTSCALGLLMFRISFAAQRGQPIVSVAI
jgi:hypothetical protein